MPQTTKRKTPSAQPARSAQKQSKDYRQLMKRLKHVRPGRTFTRDEMNER